MAACGVVCLQEFGQYDGTADRPQHGGHSGQRQALKIQAKEPDGRVPSGIYTMYYVGQALYQVGGNAWEEGYPLIRDSLIASQKLAGQFGAAWIVGRRAACHRRGRPALRHRGGVLRSRNPQPLPADSAGGEDRRPCKSRRKQLSQHRGEPHRDLWKRAGPEPERTPLASFEVAHPAHRRTSWGRGSAQEREGFTTKARRHKGKK